MAPSTKRRRIEPMAVEEISFDLTARQDYLTGFHKRKVQRTKAAQEAAERRARQEKIEQRKKLREERKADLERHVAEVDAMIKPVVMEEKDENVESEDGSSNEEAEVEEVVMEPVDHEAEYIDEDKYTSVVVEEMDVTREGLRKANESSDGADEVVEDDKPKQNATVPLQKSKWTRDKPKDGSSKAKKKRKKFRYESKAERKVTKEKQRSKNRDQANARRAK